jgi:hypothetical protein
MRAIKPECSEWLEWLECEPEAIRSAGMLEPRSFKRSNAINSA